MKKVEFIKHSKKNFISIMLGNHLFKKDDEFLSKLLEVLKLFRRENMAILCRFFDDGNDVFANEVKEMFGDEVIRLFTRKKLFSKAEYHKMQVCLCESSLDKVIALAIKYCASPEIEVSDKQGVVLYDLGLNDNDGTFINFNTKEFNTVEVKIKTAQIIE